MSADAPAPGPITPEPAATPKAPINPEAAPASTPLRPRRRWLRRLVVAALVALLVGLVAAEIFARRVLTLGDPPLYQPHATIEYLMAPSRTYRRFHNTIAYNRWSMRSPDFEQTKPTPDQFRALVLGDSIVAGGPQVDDAQLATHFLHELLQRRLNRPVVIGNVSCGSWGPGNLLAYLEAFGTFDADVIVLVLNHEDAADVPTFAPLSRDLPTRSPTFALEEAFGRYVPMLLGSLGQSPAQLASGAGVATPDQPATGAAAVANAENEARAMASLRGLVALARGRNIKVVAVLHQARSEIEGATLPGTRRLARELADLDVPTLNTRDTYRPALLRGDPVYRDDIHLMPQGQRALADVLLDAVAAAR